MVVADDRERNSKIIKFLSDLENVSVAMKRLAVGRRYSIAFPMTCLPRRSFLERRWDSTGELAWKEN
jgi:hypothetical protein